MQNKKLEGGLGLQSNIDVTKVKVISSSTPIFDPNSDENRELKSNVNATVGGDEGMKNNETYDGFVSRKLDQGTNPPNLVQLEKTEKQKNKSFFAPLSPSKSDNSSVPKTDEQILQDKMNRLNKNIKEISDIEKNGVDYRLSDYPHKNSTGTMTFMYPLYNIYVGSIPKEQHLEEKARLERRSAIQPMLLSGLTGAQSTWGTIKNYLPTLWNFSFTLPNRVVASLKGGAWHRFWAVGLGGTFRFLAGLAAFVLGGINIPFKWFSRFTIAFVTPRDVLNKRNDSLKENFFLKWWKDSVESLEYLGELSYKNAGRFGKAGLHIKNGLATYPLSIPFHILNIFLFGTIKLILDRAVSLINYTTQIVLSIFTMIGTGRWKDSLYKISDSLKRMSPEIIGIIVGLAMSLSGFALPMVVAAAVFAVLIYSISGVIISKVRGPHYAKILELTEKAEENNSTLTKAAVLKSQIRSEIRAANIKTAIAVVGIAFVISAVVLSVALTSGLAAFALPFALTPGAILGGGGYTALGLWLSMGGLGIYAWASQKLSATFGTHEKVELQKDQLDTTEAISKLGDSSKKSKNSKEDSKSATSKSNSNEKRKLVSVPENEKLEEDKAQPTVGSSDQPRRTSTSTSVKLKNDGSIVTTPDDVDAIPDNQFKKMPRMLSEQGIELVDLKATDTEQDSLISKPASTTSNNSGLEKMPSTVSEQGVELLELATDNEQDSLISKPVPTTPTYSASTASFFQSETQNQHQRTHTGLDKVDVGGLREKFELVSP